MPTEAELRDRLHDDGSEPGALDTADIIRRAKARRRPKRIAAGIAGGVAAVGALAFVLPVTLGLGGAGLSTAGGGSAADEAAAGEDASTLKEYDAPESAQLGPGSAMLLNRCAAPVAVTSPDPGGLELTVAPVTGSLDAEWVETTVTLTNTGDSTAEGITGGTVALTLAGDGTVLWHSNGPTSSVGVLVDLDPGESMTYPAAFRPVSCSPEDDASELGFPSELPPVEPGSYQLSAAIDLMQADGAPSRLITGPATTVTLQ